MIDNLPTELLSVVRKYLGDDDLFCLAQTNHRLRAIITSSDELWKVSLLNKWYRPDLLPPPFPAHKYYAEYVSRTRSDKAIRKRVEEVAEKCPASESPEMNRLLEELSSYSYDAFYILDKLQNHFGPESSCVVKSGELEYEAYTAREKTRWLNSRIEDLSVVWVARCCLERLRFQRLCESLMDAAETAMHQKAEEGEAAAAMMDLCLVDPNFFELNRIRLRVLDKTVSIIEGRTYDSLMDKANEMWACLKEAIRSEVKFSFDGPLEHDNDETLLVFDSFCLLRFYSGDNPGTGVVWAVAMYELCRRLSMTVHVCYTNVLICEAGETVLMSENFFADFAVTDHRRPGEPEPQPIASFPMPGPGRRLIFKDILMYAPPAQRNLGGEYVRSFEGDTYIKVAISSHKLIESQNSLCANYSIQEANVVNIFRCLFEYLLHKSSQPGFSPESADIFLHNKFRTSVMATGPFLRLLEGVVEDSIARRRTLYADLLTLLRQKYSGTHRFEIFGPRMGALYRSVTAFEPGCIFEHVRTHVLVIALHTEPIYEENGEAAYAVTCYTNRGEIMKVRGHNLVPIGNPDFKQACTFAEFDEIGEFFKGYDPQRMKFVPNAALQQTINAANMGLDSLGRVL